MLVTKILFQLWCADGFFPLFFSCVPILPCLDDTTYICDSMMLLFFFLNQLYKWKAVVSANKVIVIRQIKILTV